MRPRNAADQRPSAPSTAQSLGSDRSVLTGPEPGFSRRRILKRAVGLAAAGAVGGSLLAESQASPALAAGTTEPGAVAPAVVVLTDGPTIAVDASLGNDFRLTLGGDHSMENPINALDGQQIIFQITQASGGPHTLNWGSDYEFSTSLPEPTLSTSAGQTDVLGFVYNAARGTWLLTLVVAGFNPATTTTQPTGMLRLFPSTNGPSTVAGYTGNFGCGVAFEVTTGGCWLEGFWWWVAQNGQSTAAQTFTLFCCYTGGGSPEGVPVPGTSVTSGSLVPGQWNYIELAEPVPLAIGCLYVAATWWDITGEGVNTGFPVTGSEFSSGNPYAAGITNGPLFAFSDTSGTSPSAAINGITLSQGLFTTGGQTQMPNEGYDSSNFWMDVQVTTTAPSGASYRLWPSFPQIAGNVSNDYFEQSFGTEFTLSDACLLNNIWFYSPTSLSSGGPATVLPAQCAIFDVSSQEMIAGTLSNPAQWSGAPGTGWVSCSYDGSVTLPPGDYKVCVFMEAQTAGVITYQENTHYFGTGTGNDDTYFQAGINGITSGPLSSPNCANAAPCVNNGTDGTTIGSPTTGNSTYSTYNAGFIYPDILDSEDNGESRWVDVEVTPT